MVDTDPDVDQIVKPSVAVRLDDVFRLAQLKDGDVPSKLAQWRQGDIVEDVRILWGSDSDEDPLVATNTSSGSNPPSEVEGREPKIDPSEGPVDRGWKAVRASAVPPGAPTPPMMPRTPGIITSQTCDIGAGGPGARHPTVQVSPLIRLDQLTTEKADDIRDGRVIDMVVVAKGAGLIKEGEEPSGDAAVEWAADLRISIPISKWVLVNQDPKHGFASERAERQFADRVAMKALRPAVHDAVINVLADSIGAVVRSARGKGHVWIDRVEQVRVRANKGTLLEPDELKIFVVTLDEPLTHEEMKPLRDWHLAVRKPFADACDGCLLPALRFKPLDTMSVEDYRTSERISIPDLRQGHWL